MYAEGAFHAYSVGRGRRTSLFVGLVAAATTATTLTTEAIAAVDGAVAAGQERYRGLIAAFCANHRVHLAGTTVAAETTVVRSVCTPCITARGAALGFVCVSLFGMVRLIVRREYERLSTLHAS